MGSYIQCTGLIDWRWSGLAVSKSTSIGVLSNRLYRVKNSGTESYASTIKSHRSANCDTLLLC